eukprot:gene20681-62330_t
MAQDCQWKSVTTFGCGSAIASSSYSNGAGRDQIKGKTLEEAVEMSNRDIAAALSLPPVKIHCSLLAEGAVKAAVRDLVKKRPDLKTKVREDLRHHVETKQAAQA